MGIDMGRFGIVPLSYDGYIAKTQATHDPEKVIAAQVTLKAKLDGVQVQFSAQSQALLERALALEAQHPQDPRLPPMDPSRLAYKRFRDDETPASRQARNQSMSEEERVLYVEQKMLDYDTLVLGMAARAERDVAIFGESFHEVTVSRTDYEAAVRLSLESPDVDLNFVLGARDMTAEYRALGELWNKALTGQWNDAPPALPETQNASDGVATTEPVTEPATQDAGSVPGKEDSQALRLPPVSELTLGAARMFAGMAATIVVNGAQSLAVRSHYGDQAITDMRGYLAAVQDRIGTLEAGLMAAIEKQKEERGNAPATQRVAPAQV